MNSYVFRLEKGKYAEYKCEILNTMLYKFPDIYLGGSYALNSLGLIDREIYDFDFCLSHALKQPVIDFVTELIKSKNNSKGFNLLGIFSTEPKVMLKKADEDDTNPELHIHEYIGDTKIGVFFYNDSGEKTYDVWDELLGRVVRVSSPEKIIKAKEMYVKDRDSLYGDVSKHIDDLDIIKTKMKDFKAKLFFGNLL